MKQLAQLSRAKLWHGLNNDDYATFSVSKLTLTSVLAFNSTVVTLHFGMRYGY